MDEIEVEGFRIAYHKQGEGPPLVLLHGWPANSREWRRQIDGLSDQFTIVAWDAPGAGLSSDPPDSFRLSDWAECLAKFVAALGLERPHVAGLSWGGGLALEFYRRHPEVPRTLILVSAYAGWAGSLPPDVVEERLQLFLRNTELPPDQWPLTYLRTLVSEHAPDDVFDEIRSIVAELHPVATRTAIRAFAAADLRGVLADIDVPTLLVYGEDDVRAPQDVWHPLHSTLCDSKLVLIPGVGHMIDLEAGDRLNTEIRSFLGAIPG